jgi:hypothetical protein
MPARHTKEPQLALLLPLAISQGWTVRKLAQAAQIDVNEANRLLREGSRHATTAIKGIECVDALTLTVELQGKTVTLGKVQGQMVSGAVRSLGRLPSDPDQWDESNDKTYRRCQTVLRDAKALGLIRFGEADKAGNPPAMRHVDPFAAQTEGRKAGKAEKSQEESSTVNDGASRCEGEGADNPPADGASEE